MATDKSERVAFGILSTLAAAVMGLGIAERLAHPQMTAYAVLAPYLMISPAFVAAASHLYVETRAEPPVTRLQIGALLLARALRIQCMIGAVMPLIIAPSATASPYAAVAPAVLFLYVAFTVVQLLWIAAAGRKLVTALGLPSSSQGHA